MAEVNEEPNIQVSRGEAAVGAALVTNVSVELLVPIAEAVDKLLVTTGLGGLAVAAGVGTYRILRTLNESEV